MKKKINIPVEYIPRNYLEYFPAPVLVGLVAGGVVEIPQGFHRLGTQQVVRVIRLKKGSMCVCVCVCERDQNMVLNLLRYHHRDK